MNWMRAFLALQWVAFRRLVWSIESAIAMLPLGIVIFAAWGRSGRWIRLSEEDLPRAFDMFSKEFVILLFTLFLLPVIALTFATTSIGGDREDRTLVFLLVRPIPRWLVLLAKYLAALPLVLGLVTGTFYVCCRLAGPVGQLALETYLSAVFLMALAYTSLFHLFAVLFRHSTMISLAYAFFVEVMLANLPGMANRIAITFYGQSMIYDLGFAHGLSEPEERFLVPVTADVALWTLVGFSVVGLLAALVVFSRREYRDLT